MDPPSAHSIDSKKTIKAKQKKKKEKKERKKKEAKILE